MYKNQYVASGVATENKKVSRAESSATTHPSLSLSHSSCVKDNGTHITYIRHCRKEKDRYAKETRVRGSDGGCKVNPRFLHMNI